MYDLGFLPKGSLLKKLLWFKAVALSGAASIIKTVTGTAPITLTNAISHAIISLTQYGKCVQDGTPTPDNPVDILCNNGVLRYSANMANVNEQTASIGYYISAQGAVLADSFNWYYQLFVPVKPNTTYTLSMSTPVYYVTISEYSTPEDSGFVIRKNGTTGGNRTLTITTGATTNYIRFGANLNRVTVSLEMVIAIDWMLNIGGTAMDYQPYVKGGIYTDGTPEVLTVYGQNFVDLNAVTNGYYYSQSGVYTELAVARLTDYIPVKSGQKYTVYVKAEQAGTSANVRCNLFDSAKAWKSQSTFSVSSGTANVGIVTPAEDGYLRVSANYAGTGAKADWSVLQIVLGEYTLETMPPYQPYHAPQTVNDVPMLLSTGAGGAADEWEGVGGNETSRVFVKVLDGTEKWGTSSYYGAAFIINLAATKWSAAVGKVMCTHFVGTTPPPAGSTPDGTCYFNSSGHFYFRTDSFADTAAFTDFLAAQYAAGTPVIVVLERKTEQTEQTTPHSLHSYNGTTIVDAQTNVDPVELAAEYKATQ